MKERPIYMDYNATTPCDPRVVESMMPFFTLEFGNAASTDHRYGWMARESVEDAREQVASLIGATSKRVIFTSGATESVNLAIKGIAESLFTKGNHIITCKTEHKAVLDTCAYLETKGYQVTYLEVDARGQLSLESLEAAIGDKTICIALMYANNETGVVHPVQKIGVIARKHGVPFVCDATQAVGKIPVNVDQDGIDLLAFSAHKMYGPKGVGALFTGKNLPVTQQHGGNHEWGLRSGTLNTPAIIGFGKAAELCSQEMLADADRLRQLRDGMEHALPDLIVNGSENRLPHVTNFLLPQGDAEQLLLSLSPYLAASRGSACSSGLIQQPSHVLKAMGLSDAEAHRAVRISLGRFTTRDEADSVVQHLTKAIRALVPAGVHK
jgi:cysteine desulfurase